ncbi:MAG: DUF1559 domain-containing protein, partial [Planctomycetaceae bacterium]
RQWTSQLLPFLEQPLEAEFVSVLGCPSDRYRPGGHPYDNMHRKFQRSYQINDGVWNKDANGMARAPLFRGEATRLVRPADVTDGLSSTAAFAEKLDWPPYAPENVPVDSHQEDWNRRIHNTATYRAELDPFFDECDQRALPPGPYWYSIWGYNHVMTPNRNSCFNGPRWPWPKPNSKGKWAITATSEHSAGVHVLFADGAVRFVGDSIDRTVWRALGTRNGEETVGSF